jgi:hypothetical protein
MPLVPLSSQRLSLSSVFFAFFQRFPIFRFLVQGVPFTFYVMKFIFHAVAVSRHGAADVFRGVAVSLRGSAVVFRGVVFFIVLLTLCVVQLA